MEQLLKVFKVLSDRTRLKMVKLLYEREMCVCQMEAIFNVSQSRISQNLRLLKNSGLVDERRDGKWVYYKTNKAQLAGVFNNLEQFMQADFKNCIDMKEECDKYEKIASKISCN